MNPQHRIKANPFAALFAHPSPDSAPKPMQPSARRSAIAQSVILRPVRNEEHKIDPLPVVAPAPAESGDREGFATDSFGDRGTAPPEPSEQIRLARSIPDAVYRSALPDWLAGIPGLAGTQGFLPWAIEEPPASLSDLNGSPQRVAIDPGWAEAFHEPAKARAYGGDRQGRLGVAPIERQAMPVLSAHATSKRLSDAISEYVDERLTRHLAEMIRQGIVPRS
ncbi:MAG: hypothetical protein P4L46_17490 [Fimbriimonas sp.]|nr:hypothetical protein [Fimbriimonas sp.]